MSDHHHCYGPPPTTACRTSTIYHTTSACRITLFTGDPPFLRTIQTNTIDLDLTTNPTSKLRRKNINNHHHQPVRRSENHRRTTTDATLLSFIVPPPETLTTYSAVRVLDVDLNSNDKGGGDGIELW
ncbi:unnamed protein product [Lactuca virosa]|uniref:Uncharacterized protein n=1 Tax=Lactuca virosa TaxID=75947 RepID=A0AAU9M5G1_9ASTR|nr:unnamed protein product [Lactuca virosa]